MPSQSSSRRSREAPADQLTRSVLAACDAVGGFIEWWGFKSILGRVWTLVALRRRPMTQTEIARTLGVSRSLVCSAIAELTERGLVRPVGTHRNAPYEACLDVWASITDVLRQREWLLIEQARVALEAARDEIDLAGEQGDDVPYDAGRARMLLALTEMAQTFLRIVLSLRVPDSVKGLDTWVRHAAGLLRRFRRQ